MFTQVGIKQVILQSNDIEQIGDLVKKARGFEFIHPKTLRKIERAATKRENELKAARSKTGK